MRAYVMVEVVTDFDSEHFTNDNMLGVTIELSDSRVGAGQVVYGVIKEITKKDRL